MSMMGRTNCPDQTEKQLFWNIFVPVKKYLDFADRKLYHGTCCLGVRLVFYPEEHVLGCWEIRPQTYRRLPIAQVVERSRYEDLEVCQLVIETT